MDPGDLLSIRGPGLTRFLPILPLEEPAELVTLGEGGTPLLPAHRLGKRLGTDQIWIKEESSNPTASFKARGMAIAVSMARKLGLEKLIVPSAGNAGSALAAYSARAGLEARVVVPEGTPPTILEECRAYGAQVEIVPGSIAEAGRRVAEIAATGEWFDVSTLKEPYRLEGKKTMGYELAESFEFDLPEVIVYPTGGGTGLIGMVKAFDEMESLGWIDVRRPRFFAVQASGCAPIVRAFEQGAECAEPWSNPRTRALGLRVPSAIGDFLILRTLRETDGGAVAVEEAQIESAVEQLARSEGIYASAETGAVVAGLDLLIRKKIVRPEERVVVFSTGSALKYH